MPDSIHSILGNNHTAYALWNKHVPIGCISILWPNVKMTSVASPDPVSKGLLSAVFVWSGSSTNQCLYIFIAVHMSVIMESIALKFQPITYFTCDVYSYEISICRSTQVSKRFLCFSGIKDTWAVYKGSSTFISQYVILYEVGRMTTMG